jgi:hypothetical protein
VSAKNAAACVSLLAAGMAAALTAATMHAGPQENKPRSVFVAVADAKGASIPDFSVADVSVKAGGKDAAVTSVTPASDTMTISVLVSDDGSGVFRGPLARFLQKLQTRARFSLNSVVGQSLRVSDFTSDGVPLSAGLARLGPRERTPGGQLLSAISGALVELLKREDAAPVLLVLSVGGVEHISIPDDQVLEELRKSRAVMHVISIAGTAMRTARTGQAEPVATDAVSQQRAALAESEQFAGASDLNNVLDRGPAQSGGRRQEVLTATALLSALERAADDLAGRYLITYVPATGTKPGDRLSISTKRKGLVLRAPTRLPD